MGPLAIVGGVLTAAGVGASIAGQVSESDAKAAALERDAALKRQQGMEAMARARLNVEALGEQAKQVKAGTAGAFAMAGVGGESLFATLTNTDITLQREIYKIYRDAEFRQHQIEMGAESDILSASGVRSAQSIQTWGTVLGGAGSILGGASKAGAFDTKEPSQSNGG